MSVNHRYQDGQGLAEDEADDCPEQQRDAQVRAPTQARQRRRVEGG
jgi:hypothetical protein